jgi:hypothetical protein
MDKRPQTELNQSASLESKEVKRCPARVAGRLQVAR